MSELNHVVPRVSADVLEEVDIACLRLPDGKVWVGYGPFTEVADAPDGPAFYVNDFELGDGRPWKIPARMEVLEKGDEFLVQSEEELNVVWRALEPEWFEMVFRRIRKEVVARRLKKMVPVLTELGVRQSGRMSDLLGRALRAPEGLWAYGRVQGDEGFAGATPELLLKVEGGQLETMALAGTASPVDGGGFVSDTKEIEEHELVAGFIESALSGLGLGVVERGPREVSDASGLTHFRTQLRVTLEERPDLGALVRLLHPTPAVGCLPRDEGNLTQLMEYRKQLHAPGFFGAPFGLKTPDGFYAVVAIRGLGWRGDEVSMPSGCGIVGGSVFDHEWRELRQKRETVSRMLGV
ncbi:hypothetical protein FEM03_14410 [Phragmitibacter flavus]|uniref:Chorismate-utilising enzyme C-terminal domain-containing protein n=1 Tax=Phragmitibacter flavus TaxID=2576071 RepID=A0A5R8KC69_9BACT|nr:chorismate-binding protein [Phragmitibacter flavus]TLD69923.1 hypothetical protein FEM03_14410 [Phragmitibacter flavus]